MKELIIWLHGGDQLIIQKFKILKKEKCPCGSNKLYRDCCYQRVDEEIDITHKKKVLLDIAKDLDAHKMKACLYPIKNECKMPIKSAHMIQNHGVLSQISYKRHVLGFPTSKTEPLEILAQDKEKIYVQRKLEKIGVNEATTHTCFCNYHDSKIFRPIESNPNGFQSNDREQLFLFAYKAFASEYYRSKVSMNLIRSMFKRMPQKLKRYPVLFVPAYREAQKKDREMEFYKKQFDNIIINKSYSEIYTEIIEIPFKIEFASVDCISPTFDISGKRVKQISKGLMRRLFMTIFPDNHKSYILISCINEDRKNFGGYINLLKNTSYKNLFNYLSYFLPLYSESIILNPLLVEKWSKEGKSAYTSISNLIGSYLIKAERNLFIGVNEQYRFGKDLPECKCNLFETI